MTLLQRGIYVLVGGGVSIDPELIYQAGTILLCAHVNSTHLDLTPVQAAVAEGPRPQGVDAGASSGTLMPAGSCLHSGVCGEEYLGSFRCVGRGAWIHSGGGSFRQGVHSGGVDSGGWGFIQVGGGVLKPALVCLALVP